MAIQVRSEQYIVSHGSAPHPYDDFGMFTFEDEFGDWSFTTPATMNYTSAKKMAKQAYKNRFDTNYGIIKLAP